MGKIHITDDGRLLACSADIQECKYAKEETSDYPRHFDENDVQKATFYKEKLMKKKYGAFHQPVAKLSERKKSLTSFENSSRTLHNIEIDFYDNSHLQLV